MNYATIKKTETLVNSSDFYINQRKDRLLARWLVVEGKLVCKWFINE